MLAVALYSGIVVLRQIDAVQAEAGGLPSRLPAGDARRVRFDALHLLSTRLMMFNIVGALVLLYWEARGEHHAMEWRRKHRITLIPGDGIGPEVTRAVVTILEAAGLDVEWEPHLAGASRDRDARSTLPAELLESITRNKVALKGPVTTPVGGGFTSVNVGLRKALELFANLRPVWNIPSVPSRYEGVDLVIVRENTEDLYSGLEHEVVPGVVESLKIITCEASTRIAGFAFEYARAPWPQARHRRPQGEHHEDERRPVPEVRAGRRGATIRTSRRTTASSTPRACIS